MVVAEQAPSTWERSPDLGSREGKPDSAQGQAIVMDQLVSARQANAAPDMPLGEPGVPLRLFAKTRPGPHYWVMCVPVSPDTEEAPDRMVLPDGQQYPQE